MIEEIICECGNNTFRVSITGDYLLCEQCKKLERIDIIKTMMDSINSKEDTIMGEDVED